MPPIKNWEKVIDRSVSEVKQFRSSVGIVTRWEHEGTGDTITIERVEELESPELYHGGVWYKTKYNGEAVTSHSSLRKAKGSATESMKHSEDGL